MFTGIIQELGIVERIRRRRGGARLTIKRPNRRRRLARGESVAVDGVCLTVIASRNGAFEADLSSETLSRTALGDLKAGAEVNLERALRLSDRLGGHLVQGHVDAVGKVVSVRPDGEFVVCRWKFPREFAELVVPKGSIAVNGVSLTIVDPDQTSFAAALIPETLRRTNLVRLRRGDPVNLEFDLMAKFAKNLISAYLRDR